MQPALPFSLRAFPNTGYLADMGCGRGFIAGLSGYVCVPILSCNESSIFYSSKDCCRAKGGEK